MHLEKTSSTCEMASSKNKKVQEQDLMMCLAQLPALYHLEFLSSNFYTVGTDSYFCIACRAGSSLVVRLMAKCI